MALYGVRNSNVLALNANYKLMCLENEYRQL